MVWSMEKKRTIKLEDLPENFEELDGDIEVVIDDSDPSAIDEFWKDWK